MKLAALKRPSFYCDGKTILVEHLQKGLTLAWIVY